MITFDEYGARFDGEGTLILKTDHLAELAKKDKESVGVLWWKRELQRRAELKEVKDELD